MFRFLFSLSTIFMVAVCLMGCHGEPPVDAIIGQNEQLDRRYRDAYKAQDLDGIMSCFVKSDDAFLFPADNIDGWRGWKDIRRAYSYAFHITERVIDMQVSQATYYPLADTAVVGSATVVLTVVPKGVPKHISLAMHVTSIRKKIHGAWQYAYIHESTVPVPVIQ